MHLKKLLVLFLFVVPALLFASGGRDSRNDGKYDYKIDGFTAIDGSSAFQIEVRRDDRYSVTVFADPSLRSKLIVEKRGGVLRLGLKPFTFSHSKSPRAVITMPVLQSVDLSGSVSMIAAGFRSNEDFECHISGASSLELDLNSRSADLQLSGSSKLKGVMETGGISLELSGSSTIELTGRGEAIEADLTGASKGNLRDFHTTDAEIDLSGSSDLYIYMSGTINLDATGASHLYYTGNVTPGDIELSGASSMKEIR